MSRHSGRDSPPPPLTATFSNTVNENAFREMHLPSSSSLSSSKHRSEAEAASSSWELVSVQGSCSKDEYQTWTVRPTDTDTNERNNIRRTFLVRTPPALCDDGKNGGRTENDNVELPPEVNYPIFLAFHGYGGNPRSNLQKWKRAVVTLSSSSSSEWIMVVPQGYQGGWNAIDCCGEAVMDDIDDVDFVDNGIIQILKQHLLLPSLEDDEEDEDESSSLTVVAAGFSNGAFFSSYLGLLQTTSSPPRFPWLKGIIPASGYQYDTTMYETTENDNKNVDIPPLPILSLHGGMDTTVLPGGCCLVQDKKEKGPALNKKGSSSSSTNCPLKIGSLRDTCLSVHGAFELWVRRNGCDDDQIRQEKKKDYTCWAAANNDNCSAITKLCFWPKAHHSYQEMVGADQVVADFLNQILLSTKSAAGGTSNGRLSKGSHRQDGGPSGFGLGSTSALIFLLIATSIAVVSYRRRIATGASAGNKVRRTISETEEDDDDDDEEGEEMVELVVNRVP